MKIIFETYGFIKGLNRDFVRNYFRLFCMSVSSFKVYLTQRENT